VVVLRGTRRSRTSFAYIHADGSKTVSAKTKTKYCGDLQLIIESHGLCPHLNRLMTHRSMVNSCRPAAYGATITHLNVHRSCRWKDAFNSLPTKCSDDRDPLISCKSSTSPTATSSAQSRYWLRDAISCSPRPRNSSWLRHVDEFPRQEDSVDLRQLRSIRRSVSRPVVQSLVTSLVLSRPDYLHTSPMTLVVQLIP